MDPDLRGCLLDAAEAGEFLHGLKDRIGVPERDLVDAGAVAGVVGEVLDAAREGHRPGGVGQQHPDGDGGWLDLPEPDLVQRFLDDAVQGFPGETGEVDSDVLAGECLLDERAQSG